MTDRKEPDTMLCMGSQPGHRVPTILFNPSVHQIAAKGGHEDRASRTAREANRGCP